jgi:hypothetical protein
MAVLDCSPSALKILYNSNEFMPYVVFIAAPGLDEMRHIYENGKMAGAIMASQRTLNNFEKTSSIRRSEQQIDRTSRLVAGLYLKC